MKTWKTEKGKKCGLSTLAVVLVLAVALFCPLTTQAKSGHPIEFPKKAVEEYNLRTTDSTAADGSKYIQYYYGYDTDVSWCVIFAWYCADIVGVDNDVIGKTASATYMQNGVESRDGVIHTDVGTYKPKVGDMVRLDYHLMTVTAVSGDNVTVTHGNWGGTLSQDTYSYKDKTFGGKEPQNILSYISPWYKGDYDHDQQVTSTDARMILSIYSGKVESPEQGSALFKRCDIDGDGQITSTDARLVLQMYSGDYGES